MWPTASNQVDTMSQIDLLFRLQQLDSDIRHGKQRLGEIINAQREPETLKQTRVQTENARHNLRRWQTTHHDLELELATLTDKIQQAEKRLYSGQIKNTRELADLQSSVTLLKRQQAALEDNLLEALLELEDARQNHTVATQTWNEQQAAWQTQHTALSQEQNSLALNLGDLLEQRQALASRLDANLVAEYEAISRKRHGTGVAQLRLNMCLGCQVTVPANTVRAAQEGRIAYCTNCGRILKP